MDQNDDLLRVKCDQCHKIMFNIEFDNHECVNLLRKQLSEGILTQDELLKRINEGD